MRKKNNQSSSEEISKKDFDDLKRKLKLDEKALLLLINSRGSIRSKSFFNKVTEGMEKV